MIPISTCPLFMRPLFMRSLFMRRLAAFVAGAIMVFALAPWNMWPVLFLGLSSFYIILSSAPNVRSAFAYGWLFGFGYFVFGLSWIGNALLVEGNKFLWVWPFAVIGLPAFLAFFTASACALTRRFRPLKSIRGFLLFSCLMMAFEWLRGHILTGFPWNLYGYTWAGTLPIAQLVSIGGIYWLSLITCLWASLPGFLIVGKASPSFKRLLFASIILTMGGSYYYGYKRINAHPTELREDIAIKLIQPNISQEDKWNPDKAGENLRKLLKLSEAEKINDFIKTIIIWPETALSDYVLENEDGANSIKKMLSGYKKSVYLFSGILRYKTNEEGERDYFNSLSVFDKDLNKIATYDKAHLVPFGEYIPLQKWLPLKPFVKFSGFKQGEGSQNINIPNIGVFSPLVCYEIIFPGKVTENITGNKGSNKGKRPDFIVNVTNDSWYGNSHGPRQHFVQTQFRAIEEGVPVIRAANTGISGIIDPVGRIIYRVNLLKTSGKNSTLPLKTPQITTYSGLKDKIFFLTLLIIAIFSLCFQLDRINSNKN